MLESIRAFFSELSGGQGRRDRFAEDDYRVAAAALLVHALHVDGGESDVEREKLREVLSERFALDRAATEELIREATAAEGEAVDLYRFTSLLNRDLDDEGRRRIVEMLWQLSYADGRINEFEDNLIWRVADLLHVSPRERMLLRQQIASETNIDPRAVKRGKS